MRTRNYFKYLLATLALLGNVSLGLAQQTRITFDFQGGWYNGEQTQVTATYNHDMPLEDIRPSENRTVKLGIPKSNDGTFGGYYDQRNGQGTQYYKNVNGTIQSAHKWDKTVAEATLYAYWGSGNPEPANTYTVTLDRQGGTGGTTSVTATLNAAMPDATKPLKEGYTFGGYFTEQNGAGVQYYNADMNSVKNWDISNNTTLYASWVSVSQEPTNTYTVTLDPQGGTGGTTSVTATLNSTMPSATAPTVSSWKFDGYYTEKYGVGEMYYTPEMTSARNWDISSDATLYACWKYRVALHRNDGTGSVDYVYTNKDKAWPNAPIPTRTGYIFEGYYTRDTKLQCYDSEMRSVTPWRSGGSGNIDAYWTAKTYSATIHYLSNDSRNIESTQIITAGIDGTGTLQPSSEVSSKDDYTLLGWSTTVDGNVVYHNNDSFSPRNTDTDEGKGDIYLYAIWKEGTNSSSGTTYTVYLDHKDGTGIKEEITVEYGKPMPRATVLSRVGYDFAGYTRYDGKQFYDENMNSLNNWDFQYGATLDAKWIRKRYVVTLDGTEGAVVPDQFQYETSGTECVVLQHSDGVVKIEVAYGGPCQSTINKGRYKKSGFKLVGFYDSEGNLVATVDVNDASKRDIKFTNACNYWKQEGDKLIWNYPDNLTLTARYVPKYKLEDANIINFGNEYLELGVDWENGVVNDAIGAVRAEIASGNISKENPVMVFDLRNAQYEDGSTNNIKEFIPTLEGVECISPNLLIYLGEHAYDVNGSKNAVEMVKNNNEVKYVCKNFVVTDRYPIKIPYGFTAKDATYERNKEQKGTDDAMWQQSKESVWGTLCLPYPIRNNQSYTDENGIKYEICFYELRGTHDSYMQFYKMQNANQVIQANTPVLYCRTAGIGSAVSVIESSGKEDWATPIIPVSANVNYQTTVIDYSNKNQVPLAEESISDWRFVGTLEEKTFIGSEYRKPENYGPTASPGAIEVKDRDIYYFASNKFTHMNSLKGKVVVLPYRAYFEDYTDFYASSKVSSYSILVVDADGTTTDITNLIDNHEAKGNGKIYDLSGRRVKQPVKGSIYIVDGKKKMY